jgi:hypothetical protein
MTTDKNILQSAMDKASGTLESMKNAVTGGPAEHAGSKAGKKVDEAADATSDAAHNAKQAVKNTADDAKHEVNKHT